MSDNTVALQHFKQSANFRRDSCYRYRTEFRGKPLNIFLRLRGYSASAELGIPPHGRTEVVLIFDGWRRWRRVWNLPSWNQSRIDERIYKVLDDIALRLDEHLPEIAAMYDTDADAAVEFIKAKLGAEVRR